MDLFGLKVKLQRAVILQHRASAKGDPARPTSSLLLTCHALVIVALRCTALRCAARYISSPFTRPYLAPLCDHGSCATMF